MNNSRTLALQVACALSLALITQGCREDLGCPPGTVMVGDICEDVPDTGLPSDMGVRSDASAADAAAEDGCATTLFYPDLDEDGLGAGDPVSACAAPDGHVANADDCDDTCGVCGNGEEVCDGEDNDCDGDVDEDIMVVCGTDTGVCATGIQLCVGGVLGACEGGVRPAVAEVCEGTNDENCDGEVDEDCECAVGQTRPCGTDTGACSFGTQTCDADGVYGDCEGAVGPITELCNDVDDDCDGVVDNGNPGGGASCGTDEGECVAGVEMCVDGEVDCVGDVGPVPEVCNGKDDNCAGGTDEGVTTTYYRDVDMDTRGNPSDTTEACSAPSGYVANANDCNDGCSACWTGHAELCDGVDNNCVGGADETFACELGTTVACTTTCGTTGTGACTGMCAVPDASACTPPAETCNGVDDNCNGFTDEGVRTFGGSATGPLGNAAKVARSASGYVGILRYNGLARLYATNASGAVTQTATNVDTSDVSSVDIARVSDTQWVTATGFGNGGANVRLIGLSSGAPVSQDVELATGSAGGIARVAAISASDAMTVYQSGSSVRVAHVDFAGAVAPSVALPGSNPRAELGMDIAAVPYDGGYVVTWVSGLSPVVNIARVSAPSMTVTSSTVVGAGSNPSVALSEQQLVGIAYAGSDGRPRLHVLYPALTCVGPQGAPAADCSAATSDRIVATPVGAGTFDTTLDLVGDGHLFWLAARTTDGELLQRTYGPAYSTIDDAFRPATTTAWVSLAVTEGSPLLLRGGGTGFTHNVLACAP